MIMKILNILFEKKIIGYLIILNVAFISFNYLNKIFVNLSKFLDPLYFVILFIFTFFILKYLNLGKLIIYIINYLKKINLTFFHNVSLLSFFLTILFAISSIILNKFDITTVLFEKDGYYLVYCFLKLIFLIGIIISIINSGYIFSSLFYNLNSNNLCDKIIIIALGIIILSILGVSLGLAQLLYFSSNFIIFCLLILFSKKSLIFFLNGYNYRKNYPILENFYLLALISSLLILFFNSQLPFIEDGDTWVHYLNFYYEVINNNQIFSIKYPAHFAQNKGFGLNYLTLLISDVFSAQIISFIFMLSIFLMFYDICSKILGDKFIIGLTSIFIFSYSILLNSYIFPVSLNKLHISFNFFYALIIWQLFYLLVFDNWNKKFLLLFIFSNFFCGFTHTIFSFIIFISLSLLMCILFFIKYEKSKILFVGITCLCFGVSASLFLNYFQLGTFEMAFLNVFENYIPKFYKLFGDKYKLLTLLDSDQIRQSFDYYSIRDTIKLLSFHYVPSIYRTANTFVLYFFIIFFFFKNKDTNYFKSILLIILLLFTSFLILIFFKSPSLQRGFFYINILFGIFFSINLIFFIKNVFYKKKIVIEILFIPIILFFLLFSYHLTWSNNKIYIESIFIKKSSFKDALLTCYDKNRNFTIDCDLLNFIIKIPNYGNFKKVYSITQSSGVAATLPRPGLINEPFFNFSLKLNSLKKYSDNEIYDELKKIDLNYFFIDLSRPIYQNQNGSWVNYNFLEKYFNVIYSKDLKYILELKKDKNDVISDPFFYNLLNLRISYLINYITSSEFYNKVNLKSQKNIYADIANLGECVNNFNQKILFTALNTTFKYDYPNDILIKNFINNLIFEIDRTYNLQQLYLLDKKYNNTLEFTYSLIGDLFRKIDPIEKFYLKFNMKKKCSFYESNSKLDKYLKKIN